MSRLTDRRLATATRAVIRRPGRLLRQVARVPLEQEAAERIAQLPAVELADLVTVTEVQVRLSPPASRHRWSLGVGEQLVLQVLVQARGYKTAFEIGTFNGGSTRILAEALPHDGRVWTIDLPPDAFDASQHPGQFTGSRIGEAYRGSPDAYKITQLVGDSTRYDFSPYNQSIDLVLVDAGHDYVSGFADTKTALRVVRPGGIVLWDDFEPYWEGLVNGICDAMAGRDFGRLAGTSFAVHLAESSLRHRELAGEEDPRRTAEQARHGSRGLT